MLSETTLVPGANGTQVRRTLIGTVTTTETREHRLSYETASWYTAIDVPAGTYDVILSECLGQRWVLVRYSGTITEEHFVNRVFTASSVHRPTERIGRECECPAQLYPYIAAEQFAANENWELAEDWSLTATQHVDDYNGRQYALWALVDPEGQQRR